MDKKNQFLEELACLCEKYKVSFSYTTDDDGVHISIDGEEVFVGYAFEDDIVEELRAAKNAAINNLLLGAKKCRDNGNAVGVILCKAQIDQIRSQVYNPKTEHKEAINEQSAEKGRK